jgi:methylated-DNA-protein-cysteine methyltransferase-like protein
MTPFEQSVLNIVRKIPKGKVMSYGQIAKYVGAPKASREVGWAMHSLGGTSDFPWWRVLNSKGIITIKESWGTQQHLLEAEGVEFSDKHILDMLRYQYHPEGETRQISLLESDDTH